MDITTLKDTFNSTFLDTGNETLSRNGYDSDGLYYYYSGPSTGAIVGSVIGGIIFWVIVIALCCYFCRRRKTIIYS
ncbi:unnamed protein product [Timema podura]|uniref:Uncharacterized protein n=1 Tax=Timema podura TaxID=61482 RepID=A0ABN7PQP1_TIMPD|nr:unnamed protein product [Timema podura]